MAESKRSASVGVWRKAMLLLAVAAGPGMACKSTSSEAPSPTAETKIMGPQECPAETLLPQENGTYVLSCTGMTPASFKVVAKGPVTFTSECDSPVMISFSDPSTLFEGGTPLIILPAHEKQTLTVSDNRGCHLLCFNTKECPPSGQINSQTGSLDVYTSKPEPTPSEAQHP